MTEKEKMLNGQIYNPADAELVQMREFCHNVCIDYNKTTSNDKDQQITLMQSVLGGYDENFHFEPPIYIDYGKNTYIGKNFYSNFGLTVLDSAKVVIGNNVLIGPNTTIATPIHPLVAEERIQQQGEELYCPEHAKPVIIQDNVWIASNVTICSGVTIGESAVIGAGSVVTKDIPARHLAYGNPCRPIRKITDKDKIF